MALVSSPSILFFREGGIAAPFAKLYFTETGTGTPVETYQDATFDTPHSYPIVADSVGMFPAVYVDPALGHVRMRIIESTGDLNDPPVDIDPAETSFGEASITNDLLALMPATTFKANLTAGPASPGDYGIDETTDALRYTTEDAPGTVTLASIAEAVAGDDVNKAVTPAGLAAALAVAPIDQSIAADGYTTLQGGLILQWGRVGPIAIDAYTDIVFPIPFPSAVFNFQHSPSFAGGAYTLRYDSWSQASLDLILVTGARVYCASSANTEAVYVDWFAIGN